MAAVVPQLRTFRLDRTLKLLGSRIPDGAEIEVIRFLPRRRVLLRYRGEVITSMLWCVRKKEG